MPRKCISGFAEAGVWHVKPDVVHSRLLNARACVDEENAIQAPLWTIRYGRPVPGRR
jgi:hypothetical protein